MELRVLGFFPPSNWLRSLIPYLAGYFWLRCSNIRSSCLEPAQCELCPQNSIKHPASSSLRICSFGKQAQTIDFACLISRNRHASRGKLQFDGRKACHEDFGSVYCEC